MQYKEKILSKNVDLHPSRPISGYATVRTHCLSHGQLALLSQVHLKTFCKCVYSLGVASQTKKYFVKVWTYKLLLKLMQPAGLNLIKLLGTYLGAKKFNKIDSWSKILQFVGGFFLVKIM